MKTRSGRRASQHPAELAEFIRLLKAEGARSYLEIGARHGDTFFEIMRALPEGSFGVAIDLPGGPWGTMQSAPYLDGAAEDLRTLGYEVEVIYGDSAGVALRDRLREYFFDAALIDGDHRYAGVRADWELCREIANMVALHDIAGVGQVQPTSGLPVEVPLLWREIVREAAWTREIVAPGSAMGIGVVWR